MQNSIESTEYDLFDYKHGDEAPMTLDEAAREAATLRASDRSRFYRVVPVDQEMTQFRVKAVASEQVYASMLERANRMMIRFLAKGRR